MHQSARDCRREPELKTTGALSLKVLTLQKKYVSADGSVDEPEGDHKFNSNPTSALYIAPNFIGELTELRVWALVRPQDQIYANREWALKMAKKKRRNRFNNVKIVANNKKTIGGGNNKPLVKLSGLSSGGKSRGRRNRKKKKLQQH